MGQEIEDECEWEEIIPNHDDFDRGDDKENEGDGHGENDRVSEKDQGKLDQLNEWISDMLMGDDEATTLKVSYITASAVIVSFFTTTIF